MRRVSMSCRVIGSSAMNSAVDIPFFIFCDEFGFLVLLLSEVAVSATVRGRVRGKGVREKYVIERNGVHCLLECFISINVQRNANMRYSHELSWNVSVHPL